MLARRLAVAEEIIAIQKKVSALLGIALNPPQADRYADGGRRDLGTPDRYPPQADQALDVARASYYRAQKPAAPVARTPPPTPARALDATERQAVLDVLHSERFCDAAPAEVYATLLDAGTYFCSERTMYRILAAAGETRERRNQRVHPVYHKPELLAEAPNELWSWDITKLLGPAKWTYFYLYVILDV